MRLVIRAWFQLDSERPCAFYTEAIKGQLAIFTRRLAIPWRAIRAWGRAEKLGDESIDLLVAVIHVVEVHRQQQER